LTSLTESHSNVVNLNVTVREWNDQIIFLHCIVPGATDRSYGIHVAKIAGLPAPVVQRANELLTQLEVNHHATQKREALAVSDRSIAGSLGSPDGQMSLFTEYLEHPAVEALRRVNLNLLSPIAAMDELRRIRAMASNGDESADEPA
jgi:DNA mismatch repair protein MutS